MNFIQEAQKIRTDVFGTIGIGKGCAVSWKDDDSIHTSGYAVPYNGGNLLGISCESVVDLDLSKTILSPTQVSDGSKIRIVEEGKLVVLAKKGWGVNTPLTLTKKGNFTKARFCNKVYAVVQSIDEDDFALVYFNKYGIVK